MLANVLRSQSKLSRSIPRACDAFLVSKRPLSVFTPRRPASRSPALQAPTKQSRCYAHTNAKFAAEPSPSNRLFVGGLSYDVTEKELQKVFAEFGELREVQIGRFEDGSSRGIAFVEFVNKKDAIAVRERHDAEPFSLDDRQVRVLYSKIITQHTPKLRVERHETPNETLFIERLPFKAEESHLQSIFSQYGTLKFVSVARDAEGKSRGVGFVKFSSVDDAAKARKRGQTEPFVLFGRKMHVSFSDVTKSAGREPTRSERPQRSKRDGYKPQFQRSERPQKFERRSQSFDFDD